MRLELITFVPNAPCGVESSKNWQQHSKHQKVPNAPCGVERRDIVRDEQIAHKRVPNAPCGVESSNYRL